MAELIMQEETSTPSTPSSGKWKIYPKGDGWYFVDDGGIEVRVQDQDAENYKITPSVATNDLTVALKRADGTDPSTQRPLWFRFGTVWRACTAALSVTKNDGTNWAALGSAELATKEVDLFCYLVWNTNLATDAVDIFWSRIPYGRLYSDFSATTTNEKYAAINATAPDANDECINIGRFAATLGVSATYLWTIPTSSNLNLIHQPIFRSRRLTWISVVTYAGGTTSPTSNTVNNAFYRVLYDKVYVSVKSTLVRGSGNRTITLFSVPFNAISPDIYPISGLDTITAAGAKASAAIYVEDTNITVIETMANDGAYWANGWFAW